MVCRPFRSIVADSLPLESNVIWVPCAQRARVAAAGFGQRRKVARRGSCRLPPTDGLPENQRLSPLSPRLRITPLVSGRDHLLQALEVQPSPKALVDWLSTVAVPL